MPDTEAPIQQQTEKQSLKRKRHERQQPHLLAQIGSFHNDMRNYLAELNQKIATQGIIIQQQNISLKEVRETAHEAAIEQTTKMERISRANATLRQDNESLQRRLQHKTNQVASLRKFICIVCHSGELQVALPCGHTFCWNCIKNWVAQSGHGIWEEIDEVSCMYCRKNINKDGCIRLYFQNYAVSNDES